MRIQSNYFNYSSIQKQRVPSQHQTQTKYKTPVSFGVYPEYSYIPIVKKEFDPYNADDSQLQNMAIAFRDCDNDEICGFINERYKKGFLTTDTDLKRRVSKDKLLPLVNKIKAEKTELVKTVSELDEKSVLSKQDLAEQKIKLKERLFLPVKCKMAGQKDVPVPNGVLLYGKANKNDIRKWMNEEAGKNGIATEEVEYNDNKPEKTFDLINQKLLSAQRCNKYSGMHTFIYVKNLDKLLTNLNDEEKMDYIDEFKTLAENASNTYHATFVTDTCLPLEDFDSASIGSQRFNLKAKLDKEFTGEEEEKLKNAKSRLQKINNADSTKENYVKYKEKVNWVGEEDIDYFTYSRSRYDM